jgi:adenosylcobinamide-phosphate synthase
MSPAMIAAASLAAGYVADLLLGDPVWLPHPVVGFGQCIHRLERWLNRGRFRFAKGFLCTIGLIAATYAVFTCLDLAAREAGAGWAIGLTAVGVFFGLANRTLIAEGRAVFAALERDLDAGRRQLSRIVGRDTAGLNAQQVRTAVFETMSENLSDGVVAPLFYFGLLGLPGMMAYKMVNTLDSMIGHKDTRYFWFGKSAARLDDVLNLIPARLTALLLALLSCSGRSFRFVWKYGSAHASPNSGYPEAALAGILDVRFGGPHTYDGERVEKPWIGERERTIEPHEIHRVAWLNHAVCFVAVLGAVALRWSFLGH